ncbi:helix-turn-helix transcriptional regulator [Symbiobacterium thermophilum]|uniref:GntR family transcriptional regulator n=2 Tax=Symbiobacterium thermophilum TaxID=2734 RepID=Q67LZ5_SYMTH|nr:WYL domain-containing protein [Symbiobacterium thermophilum]BAD41301.1 GntR family transcriptional regulator [Symbiobacterium thermophilum IAM 14863]
MATGSARAAERRFQLLTVLMGGGRPRVDELARRFGVTRRSVFRDLEFLERMGVPIVRDGGRYAVLDTFKVRPIQFQPEEVLALMAALDFGQRKRPVGGTAARSAWEKLLAVLPAAQQELATGLDRTLVVDPIQAYSLPPSPDVEAACRAAVEGPHPLRILYQSLHADAPVERVVRPYGMAYRGTALYLIGFCELRREVRIFRANRILEAQVLSTTFERPPDFDLERFLSDVWGIEFGPLMHVRVRFDREVARLVRETIWHPSQRLEEEEGGAVILRMEARGTGELARWLAGFGGRAEVLEPPELRQAVLELGQGIVRRYGGA